MKVDYKKLDKLFFFPFYSLGPNHEDDFITKWAKARNMSMDCMDPAEDDKELDFYKMTFCKEFRGKIGKKMQRIYIIVKISRLTSEITMEYRTARITIQEDEVEIMTSFAFEFGVLLAEQNLILKME